MKVYQILLIIIAILVAVVVKIAFFSGYTEKNVAKLVEKSYQIKNSSNNFKIKVSRDGKSVTIKGKSKYLYSKGLIEVDFLGVPAKFYVDTDSDEAIMIVSNYAAVGKISELEKQESFGYIEYTSEDVTKELKSKDYKYTYIDVEEINGKDCIHFTIEKENGSEIEDNIYKKEYYIDKLKGSAEKVIYYTSGDEKWLEIENDITYNTVKEVKKPDTSGLTVVNLNSL